MKLVRIFLLPALLLALAAGCKKKDSTTPAPSNTALLTGPTWRTADVRLTINGVEGTYTPPTSDQDDVKFTADGRYTETPVSGGTASGGTWAFASNETQLVITPTGQAANPPAQLAALTATDLGLSYSFTQTQVQQALSNNNTNPTATDRLILGLVLASSSFTWPGGRPPVSSSTQITSLSFRQNSKAR